MSRTPHPPLITAVDYLWWVMGVGLGAIIAGVTVMVLVGLGGHFGVTRGLIGLLGL